MQYMANLLRGNAYKLVLPYIKRDRVDLASTGELWGILDGAYDDPDRKGTAKRELETPKPANREFSVYFANFQRLMAELRWDVDARKATLYRGLSDEMKDLLLTYSPPEEWTQYTHFSRNSILRSGPDLRRRNAEFRTPFPDSLPDRAYRLPRNPCIPMYDGRPRVAWTRPDGPRGCRREAERQHQYAKRLEYARAVACQSIAELNIPDVTESPAPYRSEPRKPRPDSRLRIVPQKSKKGGPAAVGKLVVPCRKVCTAMGRPALSSSFPSRCISGWS